MTDSEDGLWEERKVVSILFCDLVGFTAASEDLDPEDVRARLRPYHAKLRQVIESYGGTVEKFVGDAVMAVFGAPVAHEDDAERAVRAGLRILEALEELNGADARLQLQVRIGINTGESLVALGAHPELGEGFVTGDVVNTASRLQGASPVNGVTVSESTYRQTERLFDYAQLEPVQVKGKKDLLTIWQATAPRARLGSDVARSYMTPLVGRDLERSLLVGTFERVVKQRTCQLVTLIGEPGVGKSRLCAELLDYVEQRPGLVRWRQGRNLPYGEGIAFWALGEIVKAECGILESDSLEDASAKLHAAISENEQDRSWLVQRLMPLVGAGSQPASQDESFAAWRRFLEGLAVDGPAVLVFEDLHWADNAMLGFLEHLAEWSDGVPLLLLCTARPEFQEKHPGWAAAVRNAQKVNLESLTDDETSSFIVLLLQQAVLPAETQQALIERAGGNPLYAEEFVRLLIDRRLLAIPAADVPFPDTLQALLAARLDTLSTAHKSLLQDAAVVGKVFWAGALADMGRRDILGVEQALHELARKELVRPSRSSSMEGEREFAFWHVLVRDVCYAQIPRSGRVARHRAAAAWIEAQARERVEDLADVLVHHYMQALEVARAAGQEQDVSDVMPSARRYLIMAGERALPIDVDSAEASFARALEITPTGHPERAGLLEQWARAARQQARLADARDALVESARLYGEQGAPVSSGRALTSLGAVLADMGDPQGEQAANAEALRLLEAQPPGPELVAIYGQLAIAHLRSVALVEAISAARRALHLAAELHLPEPADALSYLGAARASLGDRAGIDEMQRALPLAVERGKARDAAILRNNLSMVTLQYEGPSAALDICTEGLAFCERRGIADVALFIRAMRLIFLAAAGRPDEALAASTQVVEDARAARNTSAQIEACSVRMSLLCERGEMSDSEAAGELVALASDTREPSMMAIGYAAAAKVLIAMGRSTQPQALLGELARASAARDELYYLAQLAGLVRSALQIGNPDLAALLTHGIEPRTPLHRLALAASRASIREMTGDRAEAADMYADVAGQWREFGDIPELAYSVLGQGRCLVSLRANGAVVPLEEARTLFTSMGYGPALIETQRLISAAGATTG